MTRRRRLRQQPSRRALVTAVAVCSALLLASATAAADVSVEATLAPQRAQVGEPLRLSITVVGAQQVEAPTLQTGDDFDVQYVGPSTQISIVNGHMDARIQHQYVLIPRKEGHFTLGPFGFDYDGKHYQTETFGVDIVAGSSPPGAATGRAAGAADAPRGLRVVLSVPRQEVYLHERVPIDITLYVPPIYVSDVQYPTLAADGLLVEKFAEPTQRQQQIDQRIFKLLHFQTTIVPLRAGALPLGPATLRLSVGRGSAWQDDPFFSRFFQNQLNSQRPIDVTSDTIPLTVLPLPEEGRPAGFSGAVGSFTMDVKASPTELVAGDPLTLTVAVNGSGNVSDAEAPTLTNTDGFRTYEPHLTKGPSANDGMGVSRLVEQVLIPNAATVTTVPPVRFSYFDPQARRYQTLESQPIALVVRPRPENAGPEIVAGTAQAPRAADEHLGRDIVFIKDDPGAWTLAAVTWRPSLPFLLWQPFPPLLFLGAALYDRHRQRLRGDVRYARFTRAGREARQGVTLAEQAAARGDREAFYNAVSRTMQEYLGAKLGLPPGGIDTDAVRRGGVSAACVERIHALFATCEQIRFAPNAADGDMQGTLVLAQEIIKTLERERRLKSVAPGSEAPSHAAVR